MALSKLAGGLIGCIALALLLGVSQSVIVLRNMAEMSSLQRQLAPDAGSNAGSKDTAIPNTGMSGTTVPALAERLRRLRHADGQTLLFELIGMSGLVCALALTAATLRQSRQREDRARALREALARSEGTRTRFLEVIAHDLRQPIQAIELFSAGLQRRVADPDAAPLLDGIRSSLGSMRRMLSGLMDVSRLDAGAVAPELIDVAMADILRPIAAEFAPLAASRGLEFGIADGAAAARTDPIMLECVLRNLVSNAIRYTQAGSVTVSCRSQEGQLAITVSDTGPGIAETELSRIFQEFYRIPSMAQTTEGLGLGLAIVRRMIRLLNASLEVSSVVGQGTIFTIQVPAAHATVASAYVPVLPHPDANRSSHGASNTTIAVDDAAVLAGARVLLIDDDAQVRRGLSHELAARGMSVTAVASPAATCALFAGEQKPRFDIALVDHDLGGHLTGPALLDHLAATFHVELPALLLSGTQNFKVIAELQDGDYPWLSKPVNVDVLLREMATIAGPRPARPCEPSLSTTGLGTTGPAVSSPA